MNITETNVKATIIIPCQTSRHQLKNEMFKLLKKQRIPKHQHMYTPTLNTTKDNKNNNQKGPKIKIVVRQKQRTNQRRTQCTIKCIK